MATQAVAVTVPSSNAAGAASDVSAMSTKKTFVLGGNLIGSVIVEASAGGGFCQIAVLTGPKEVTLDVAATQIRARTRGYISGSATLHVVAESGVCSAVSLPVPVSNGVGAAVDVSALGLSLIHI